jgi:hypothetical protein
MIDAGSRLNWRVAGCSASIAMNSRPVQVWMRSEAASISRSSSGSRDVSSERIDGSSAFTLSRVVSAR